VIRPLFRPRAVRDLDEIWSYTARRWGIAQAEHYIRSIRDICLALAAGERSGTDASDLRPGYRRCRTGRHVIFYRTGPDETVEIVRILHERMDLPTHLRDG
jgi:toxin ParE1/3/4